MERLLKEAQQQAASVAEDARAARSEKSQAEEEAANLKYPPCCACMHAPGFVCTTVHGCTCVCVWGGGVEAPVSEVTNKHCMLARSACSLQRLHAQSHAHVFVHAGEPWPGRSSSRQQVGPHPRPRTLASPLSHRGTLLPAQ